MILGSDARAQLGEINKNGIVKTMKINHPVFFSIIIPVYKVESYLEECVNSVLHQTFSNIEVILVDDGSPDRCPQICDDYAEKDSRVWVIHQKNSGLSMARNAGLKAAQGEYILFLDSDDYYLTDRFLEVVREHIGSADLDVIFHRRRKFDETTDTMKKKPSPYAEELIQEQDAGRLFKLLSEKNQLDASAALKVLRRAFLIENELYFEPGLLSEDVEWFFRLAHCVKTATVINEVAYCYRLRSGSITHNKSKKHTMDMVHIVSKHAEWLKKEDPAQNMTVGLRSYLSYQYYITLGLLHTYASDEKQLIRTFRKEHQWLAKCSISKKTKLAALVVRYAGGMAPAVLGYYIAHK